MPTYVYRREDGTTFEIEQRITDPPLTHCPTTGQRVERIITGSAGLIFKGSGFYLTDYARKGNSNSSNGNKAKSETTSSGDKSN
ncbi:FmdB family zinc ribbon protein [Rhodothermus profundi]|uniref:Putative regulatory protein, FmdB family n=1 Tax=Rhodothermus profundi TaxID=633813 RepID=A0A1M6WER2_9BACT|nr:FmdB family zinc ribbon protein [Rhodothermus profundi]SHK92197.1 putative regulatory protein, FmdB family [Rhodothermus profundi]